MKIILFTNARDEKHIKEWIAHHLNLGFDFIYIFDHKSKVPIQSLLKPNPKLKIVKLNDNGNIKGPCMENAIRFAKENKYDWMMYLDADEFLVLQSYTTIHEYIELNPTYNQISFNWVLFGTSFLSTDPDGMMLENYIRCSSNINRHVKSIVKVSEVTGLYNAHIFRTKTIKNNIYCYNSIPMKGDEPWFLYINDKTYIDLPAYVAHYIYQSYSTYKTRRIGRSRDDASQHNKTLNEEQLHQLENDLVNTSIRDKYCEKNKITMNDL